MHQVVLGPNHIKGDLGYPLAAAAPAEQEPGGSIPFLRELAGAGFVAVSFELVFSWQARHRRGRRIVETRLCSGFRRHMWPILGQATLDVILDAPRGDGSRC
jgi:hypothetical protein